MPAHLSTIRTRSCRSHGTRQGARRGRRLATLLGATALMGTVLAVAPGSAALAGGPAAATPDPSTAGPLGYSTTDYDLTASAPVTVGVGKPGDPVSGTLLAMRMAGDITFPAAGRGPFPVLVFEHGNHATCQSGPGSELGLLVDPLTLTATYANGTCASSTPATDPTVGIDEARSYRGYDYLAQRLASQGYIVDSIDVNDITAWTNNANESGYLARAEIISKTLDLISSWNTTAGPAGVGDALEGRVDISRVGVMGHSRGGEGVNAFAEYNLTRPATAAAAAARTDPEAPSRAEPVPDFGPRYNLKAVFSLAPVDNQGARKPVVSGTNFATLLPYCDGDVFDLEGAPVFERSKDGLSAGGYTAAQYLVNGANHDYFNTVWTEDDANLFGFGDPNCNAEPGPGRLQPAEERQVGYTLVAGFLRDFVGGEKQFDPIVNGASVPAAVCPTNLAGTTTGAGVTCRDIIQTSYVAPHRRVLIEPVGTAAAPAVPVSTPQGDAISYTGLTTTACTPAVTGLVVTTGCGSSPDRSAGPQLGLAWAGPATLTVAPGGDRRDFTGFSALEFRVSDNFASAGGDSVAVEPAVLVTLTDTAGHSAVVQAGDYSAALEPEPGTTARKQVLNGVRIPLAAFRGVDLTSVRTIALGFGGSPSSATGSVQFNDLALQESTTPAAAASLPETPVVPLLAVAGFGVAGLGWVRGRRRRLRTI